MSRSGGSETTTARKLPENCCLHQFPADFILRHDIMLEAVAVAGEIMALDARINDHGGVLSRHIGLNRNMGRTL